MSKPKKKKVVVTKREEAARPKDKTASGSGKRVASRAASRSAASNQQLIFNRSNYLFLGLGVVLVGLGLLLMSGGSMPGPDVWEPDLIYSARRTVLAPMLILSGFGVVVFAIFKS